MNGNHHLPLPGIMSAEQQRQKQIEQIAQHAVQSILGIVPAGSAAALVIVGPPHNRTSGAVFATTDFDTIIATLRQMAKNNGQSLDIETQIGGGAVDQQPVREKIEQLHALAENLMNKVRRALMLLPVIPANAAGIRNLRQALGVEQFVEQPEAVDDADQLLKAMLDERIVQDTEQTRQGIEVVMNVMGQWEDAIAARVAAGMSEPVARRLTQACGLYGLLMHIGSLTERLDGFLAQIGDQHHAQLDG